MQNDFTRIVTNDKMTKENMTRYEKSTFPFVPATWIMLSLFISSSNPNIWKENMHLFSSIVRSLLKL
jgi:hypothetical protein